MKNQAPLVIKVPRACAQDTEWSKPVQFDAVGSLGEIDLQIKEGLLTSKWLSLGYKITTANGKFYQTKVVMLLPRIMLVNRVCSEYV